MLILAVSNFCILNGVMMNQMFVVVGTVKDSCRLMSLVFFVVVCVLVPSLYALYEKYLTRKISFADKITLQTYTWLSLLQDILSRPKPAPMGLAP